MSLIQAELFEAFRDMGVAEDKAMRVARALSRRDQDISNLEADVSILRADLAATMACIAAPTADPVLRANVDSIKADFAVIRANNMYMRWMLGASLALLAAMVLKLFLD